MIRVLQFALSFVLPLAACVGVCTAASADSIDQGQALFNTNCLGCHGTPPNAMKIDLLAAANNPGLIRGQIKTNPAMSFLAPLTDTDLANIATYIAYPVTDDTSCILGWGEVNYPTLLSPRTESQQGAGYEFRYYPPANAYFGVNLAPPTSTRHLYYLDGHTGKLSDLGDITPFLNSALSAGCP
ncbi:MAG: cytochrome c [Burkholderiales bacterium]|nr:cytochrome c [Burkholderiales bacterium]